ncbi:VOC family protein [Streptomyces sp. NPDC014646]|uniref:VOC family protein n=1 Tax=Streptomyces sp. NPDC014646 TaxID=3364877 RepID=UPI0036F99DD9
MAAFARSAPCWVDVQLPDLEAGKRFYGELFGWTFRPGEGPYADAYSGGRLVAALVAKQDGRMPTAWGIYFATDDAAASVARIREAGGTVITDPVWAGRAGVVAQAADPGGAVFGLWQAGEREGFEKQNEPVSFCWTEVHTRQWDRVDAFYEEVFGFQGTDLGASGADASDSGTSGSGTPESGDSGSDASDSDVPGTSDASGTSGAGGSGSAEPGATGNGTAEPGSAEPDTTERGSAEPGSAEPDATEHGSAASGPDFRMWSPAGTEPGLATAIGGRSVITDAFPAELPSYFLVCFAVEDCNSTAGHAVRLGGRITEPPFDIPYGRMAVLQDDQGAVFAVLQPVVSGKRTE